MPAAPEPPLVSIIMPTCNRRHYLPRALQSVLRQRHERIEVIVVNDAGEDVEDIITACDPTGRVAYLHLRQKRGPAAARNVGLRIARGDYLGFLDDDDELDPDHVATMVAELERGEHEVVYTSTRRIVQAQRGDELITVKVEDPVAEWAKQHHPDELLVHNPIPIMAPLFSRRAFEAVGPFDDTLPVLEDWEFWIRLSRRFRMKHIPVVTSTVSARADGITHTRRRDFYTSALRLFDRYRAHSEGRPDIQRAQAQLIAGHEGQPLAAPWASVLVVADRDQRPEELDACVSAILERTRGAVFELLVAAPFAPPRDHQAPQLRWHQTQGSPAEALGALVDEASGPYVAVVQADAIVRLGWLHPLVASARRHGHAMVGGQGIDPRGRIAHVGLEVGQGGSRLRRPFVGAPAHLNLDAVEGLDAVVGGVVLIEREALQAVGGISSPASSTLPVTQSLAEAAIRLGAAGRTVGFAAASQCTMPDSPEVDEAALLSAYRDARQTQDAAVATARACARQGQVEEAAARLSRHCTEHPDDANAWLVRGLVASHQQRLDEAERFLSEARRRGAERYATAVGEIMVMVAQGRFEEAFPRALTELDRYPLEKEPLHFLFASGLALGRYDEVAERLERYLEHCPDDLHQRFALATLYLQAGELLRATTHTETIARSDPGFPDLTLLRDRIDAARPMRRVHLEAPAAE